MHDAHECLVQSRSVPFFKHTSYMDHAPLVTEQISYISFNMSDNSKLTKSQLIAIISVFSSFIIKEEDSCVSSSSSDEGEFSSDEEETDTILYTILMVENTRENIPCEKLTDYIERFVPGYSRQQFKEHFR